MILFIIITRAGAITYGTLDRPSFMAIGGHRFAARLRVTRLRREEAWTRRTHLPGATDTIQIYFAWINNERPLLLQVSKILFMLGGDTFTAADRKCISTLFFRRAFARHIRSDDTASPVATPLGQVLLRGHRARYRVPGLAREPKCQFNQYHMRI